MCKIPGTKINYFSKEEISWRDQVTTIIITDEKEICWKFRLMPNMNLDEIFECVKKQFYPSQSSPNTHQLNNNGCSNGNNKK